MDISNDKVLHNINLALEPTNRRIESNYPLIQFLKQDLGIDLQDKMAARINKDIEHMATQSPKESVKSIFNRILGKKAYSIFKKSKKSFFDMISFKNNKEKLYKSLSCLNKKIAANQKYYFNFIQDHYAKRIIDGYLSNASNKNDISQKLKAWSIDRLVERFSKNINSINHFNIMDSSSLIDAFKTTINSTSNDNFKQALSNLITHPDVACSPEVQNLLSKYFNLEILSTDHIDWSNPETILSKTNEIKETIDQRLLNLIKRRQYELINFCDGLPEHYVPATVRGLHGLDRGIIESIAKKGDLSLPEHLFNSEVSAGAHTGSGYATGHSGPSNRSVTIAPQIATYFASKHGLARGVPENVWLMIYEPQKGVYMNEVEAAQDWNEQEIVTPYNKPSRFLGAVQLKVDLDATTNDEVKFLACDGFVAKKVRNGDFKNAGLSQTMADLLGMALNFDIAASENKTEELKNSIKTNKAGFTYSIPRLPKAKSPSFKSKLIKYYQMMKKPLSFFHQLTTPKVLPKDKKTYMKKRAEQLEVIKLENKKARLKQEKRMLPLLSLATAQKPTVSAAA